MVADEVKSTEHGDFRILVGAREFCKYECDCDGVGYFRSGCSL